MDCQGLVKTNGATFIFIEKFGKNILEEIIDGDIVGKFITYSLECHYSFVSNYQSCYIQVKSHFFEVISMNCKGWPNDSILAVI